MITSIEIEKYLPALGLCIVMFLWSIQIPVGPADGVPIYIIILVVLYLFTNMKTKTFKRSSLIFISIISYTFFQIIMQNINLTSHLLSISSIFVLSILISLIYELLSNSKLQEHFYFIRLLKFFLLLQLFLMVIQLFCIHNGWLSSRYSHYFLPIYRVSGFFKEPSHLALSLSPFYYLLIFRYSWFMKFFKKRSIVILVTIFFLCPSSTLFAVILISFFIKSICNISINPKKIFNFIIYTFISVFSVIFAIKLLPNFSDRVMSIFDFSRGMDLNDIKNLSSLVYIKGFQMATYGIKNFPLGVGINNMEILNDYSSISLLSPILYSINKKNGSSILFKITSEFGILGLLFFAGSLILLLRHAKNRSNYIVQAFLFAFIVSGVRGPTYFDGPLLIGISIYFFHIKNKWKSLLNIAIKPHGKKLAISI